MEAAGAHEVDKSRGAKLLGSFQVALHKILTSCGPKDFAEAFSKLRPEVREHLYSAFSEVLRNIQHHAETEFSDICGETQMFRKLEKLERLCEGKGAGIATTLPCRPTSSESPEALSAAQAKEVKEKERQELLTCLAKVEHEKAGLQSQLEARRAEVASTAAELAAAGTTLKEVHEHTKRWANRPLGKRRLTPGAA